MSEKDENEITTQDYYDSRDADFFYTSVWGQDHIHQGIFEDDSEPMPNACLRTVKTMAEELGSIGPDTRVLDIGSGYGGTARYLASRYGCRVSTLNLSRVQNNHAKKLNEMSGLADRIDIVEGSFEDMPFDSESMDVCWSIDALLHSGNKSKVIQEAHRILKPGGEFIFADPMRTEECPPETLNPILERIHLSDMGSKEFYEKTAEETGFEHEGFKDYSDSLTATYRRALSFTEEHEDMLTHEISEDFIEHMEEGLRHWVEGGEKGNLVWGIFHFRKKV